MKKLMIILLVGMLSLGLSGVAFAEEQIVQGNATTAISISPPVGITTGYTFTPNASPAAGQNEKITGGATDTQDVDDLIVNSNTPYHIQINCDTPSVAEADPGKMHRYSDAYVEPAFTLTEPFWWKVSWSEGAGTQTSTYTTVGTSPVTFLTRTDTATEDGGFAAELTYSQPVHFKDPVLASDTYRIVITFTAVSDTATE